MIVQANKNLGILFEMNITVGVYARRSYDCNLLVSEAPRKYQRSISLFFGDPPPPPFSYRGEPVFFTHVLSFQMVTGRKWWLIFEYYVPLVSAADT